MGFSGGGSNVLLPHTHDGTVAQDGGPLDFDNVTQGDLTAGDVIFSDGVHLQRLAIGTPAQQIKVNAGATAPEYFTPAAGGAAYELVGEATLGAPATSLTYTISPPINCADIAFLKIVAIGEWSPSQNVFLQFNGFNSGSSYHIRGMSATGVLTDRTNNDKGMDLVNNNLSSSGTSPFFATCEMQGNPVTQSVEFNCQSSADGGMSVIGGTYDGSLVTDFSEIRLDTSTVNMATGTRLIVFKVSST